MRNNLDARLYKFLEKHETGLFADNHKDYVTAFVHIEFEDLRDFVDVARDFFPEGGMEAKIYGGTVCVVLNDILDGTGQNLSFYKDCFYQDDWRTFESVIKKMEGNNE